MEQPVRYTTRHLLALYERHPRAFDAENPYSHQTWRSIFFWFYGEMPIDPEAPATYRCQPGDRDPRWDELIHELKALKAQKLAISVLQRRKRYAKRTHEVSEAA